MAVETSVMLVAGAYAPEISSGGQQCREVARALAGRVDFVVVATAVDPALAPDDEVDGVPVFRLPIDVRSIASRVTAGIRLVQVFAALRRRVRIVHLHGVSSKNLPITCLAWLFGMRIVVTLHTAGQDEPDAIRARGRLAYRAFRAADRVLSVSPGLSARYLAAGLPASKLTRTLNGINTSRFRPAGEGERLELKTRLGLPEGRVILFVGFFSRDKRPDVLLDAWVRISTGARDPVSLVYVGATSSSYFEVDPSLAGRLREEARRAGLADRLVFVAPTPRVDDYFRAADVFALPSVREAMPMALLEGMSCGLPCVASRLAGATDVMIEHGVNGWLVPPGDVDAMAEALSDVLAHPARATRAGAAARRTVQERYGIERAAEDWLAAYRQVERR